MTADGTLSALQARWLRLTRAELPARARQERWPLREDHCFQRVLLDAACGGRWYDHVPARPAYRHLDAERLGHAVALGERLAGDADAVTLLRALDAQSLAWRGKQPKRVLGQSRRDQHRSAAAPGVVVRVADRLALR